MELHWYFVHSFNFWRPSPLFWFNFEFALSLLDLVSKLIEFKFTDHHYFIFVVKLELVPQKIHFQSMKNLRKGLSDFWTCNLFLLTHPLHNIIKFPFFILKCHLQVFNFDFELLVVLGKLLDWLLELNAFILHLAFLNLQFVLQVVYLIMAFSNNLFHCSLILLDSIFVRIKFFLLVLELLLISIWKLIELLLSSL